MKDLKRITIHGLSTSYKLTIFRFGGTDDFWGRTGFAHEGYIGAIVWGPETFILYDNPGGYPPYAIQQANQYCCPVLVKGWEMILNNFDSIKDGDNIEIEETIFGSGQLTAKVTRGWVF